MIMQKKIKIKFQTYHLCKLQKNKELLYKKIEVIKILDKSNSLNLDVERKGDKRISRKYLNVID